MSRKLVTFVLMLAALVAAAGCGSDGDGTAVQDTDAPDANGTVEGDPARDLPLVVKPDDEPASDLPLPVEPDGGIGDGAGPVPGAEGSDAAPPVGETWHGSEVARTDCPDTEWKRVDASAFSFSVPAGFAEVEAQPIDSEIGIWSGEVGGAIEVMYDYGWYSGSISGSPGADNQRIVYSGIVGELSVVRAGDPMMIGVLFPAVAVVDGQADRLGMIVNFTDPADEIIGRCIVGSIDWR